MTNVGSTKKANSISHYVGEIGERKVLFNFSTDESIDWAGTFARLIIGNDVEDFVMRNNLLQEQT